MNVTIRKHFGQQSSLRDGTNDEERERIFRLRWPNAISQLSVDARWFQQTIDEAIEFEAWKLVGFDTFEQFCEEELGKGLDEVQAICRGVRILQAQGAASFTLEQVVAAEIAEAQALPKLGEIGRGRKRDANGISIKLGQNRREYLAARLRRDHPDILARAEAGEFKSMRAAAIAAGIVKVKTPLEQLRHWWGKASESERKSFLELACNME